MTKKGIQAACVLLSMFAAILVAGCARVTVPLQVEHPADSPQAAQLRQVAVIPFQGRGGDELAAQVEAALTLVMDGDKPYFTVPAQGHMQRVSPAVLNQFSSGRVDSQTAAQYRRTTGSQGILTGQVVENTVNVAPYAEQREQCLAWRDTGKKLLGIPLRECVSKQTYSVRCWQVGARFAAVAQMIDLARARVVYSNTHRGEAADHDCEDRGGRPDGGALMQKAVADVVLKIRRAVAPWSETVQATINESTDGLTTPEARNTFTTAVNLTKSGSFFQACALWKELADQGKATAAVDQNLAVCDELKGDLPGAKARLEALMGRLAREGRSTGDAQQALLRVNQQIANPVQRK